MESTAAPNNQEVDPKVLLEELAYAISHDLNTPLRQIKSYISLLEMELKEQDASPQIFELMDRVLESSERLRDQHNALLRYSRIGRAELSMSRFMLDQVVMDVFRSFQNKYPINIDINLTKSPIESDEHMIRGILKEIFQNAINFTKEGEIPTIRLFLYKDGKQMVLEIEDQGVGFLDNQGDKIFSLFQSLHSPITQPNVGIGAGLALALRMASRIGVEIIPSAEENRGACFTLLFPAIG